ncbi:MAG: HNH endonuclease [Phycisphaerales bacterium]|nr:HNH endonuclease [Phycisphaerales bacterium]
MAEVIARLDEAVFVLVTGHDRPWSLDENEEFSECLCSSARVWRHQVYESFRSADEAAEFADAGVSLDFDFRVDSSEDPSAPSRMTKIIEEVSLCARVVDWKRIRDSEGQVFAIGVVILEETPCVRASLDSGFWEDPFLEADSGHPSALRKEEVLQSNRDRRNVCFSSYIWRLSQSELLLTKQELLARMRRDEARYEWELRRLRDTETPSSSPSGRPTIPDDVKNAVWRRDQGQCVQCGSNRDLECDHVIPLSLGGSSSARNLQLLCQSCNRRKSDTI